MLMIAPISLKLNDVDYDFSVMYTPSKYEPPTQTEEAISEDVEIISLTFTGGDFNQDAGFLIDIFKQDIMEQIDE